MIASGWDPVCQAWAFEPELMGLINPKQLGRIFNPMDVSYY